MASWKMVMKVQRAYLTEQPMRREYLFYDAALLELEDAKAMLAWLTHLPLAMAQAAAYINENGIVFADYLLPWQIKKRMLLIS